MRTLTSLFAAALLACSMSAMAANDDVGANDERIDDESPSTAAADDGRGADANADDLSGTDGQPPHDEDELVRDDDDDVVGSDDDDLAANDDDDLVVTDNDELARNDANSATNRSADDGRGNDANAANQGSVVRDGTAKAEYNNECAWGLANGKHVQTTCAVNMTAENGKTYCFSSDKAMAAFMKDPARNMSKADSTYGRS